VLDVVVRSLFGERMAERCDEIGALFQRPQDYLEAPAVRQIPHRLPFTARARVPADRRALDRIIDAEIAARRAHPTGDPLDVLEALVASGDLSDAESRDQVVTLLGAGFDTTAATLAWMLWCVALSPELWPLLRADAVYGSVGSGSTPDEATLPALDLAGRVMRETTRLHPASAISPREAAIDLVVGGHRIPKGTLVLWSAYLAGRDAESWTDPLAFDPDRFVDPLPERRALADTLPGCRSGGARATASASRCADGAHAHHRPPRPAPRGPTGQRRHAPPGRHGRQPADRRCAHAREPATVTSPAASHSVARDLSRALDSVALSVSCRSTGRLTPARPVSRRGSGRRGGSARIRRS
jgi:hypothetical protein